MTEAPGDRPPLWDPLGAVPSLRRWLWPLLAVWIAIGQGPAFVQSLRPDPERGGRDFFQEWASARFLLDGRPIYTSLTEAIERYLGLSVHGEAGHRRTRVLIDVNAHPPTSVLLAVPLAGLSYPDATLVWNVLSLGLLALAFWLVARQLDIPLSAWSVFPIVALLLLCNPFRAQMLQAQLNAVLVALIVGAWVAERNGRPYLAGALLGLATAVKIFPAFLFVYFLVRREWKAVAAGCICLLVVTLLTAAVVGWETYPYYVRHVLPRIEPYQSSWENLSLIGLWRKLFDPATDLERVEPLWRSPLVFRLLAGFSVLGVLAVLVWRTAGANSRLGRDLAFGLTVIGMLLVSPMTWTHYFLLLLLPLALLWVHLPPSGGVRAVFLLILAGLWLDPLLLPDALIPGGRESGVASPVQTLLILELPCYALIGLFLLYLLVEWDTSRSHGNAEPANP